MVSILLSCASADTARSKAYADPDGPLLCAPTYNIASVHLEYADMYRGRVPYYFDAAFVGVEEIEFSAADGVTVVFAGAV